MDFRKLAAKLLEDGYLTLADLALDLSAAGVKYNELFGFKPEIEVLRKMEKEIADAR